MPQELRVLRVLLVLLDRQVQVAQWELQDWVQLVCLAQRDCQVYQETPVPLAHKVRKGIQDLLGQTEQMARQGVWDRQVHQEVRDLLVYRVRLV